MVGEYEIHTDGRTVWINGEAGLLARFGLAGIDIHRPLNEQQKNGECLFCTHAMTTANDWDLFVLKVEEHFAIKVPAKFKPQRFNRATSPSRPPRQQAARRPRGTTP